MLPSVTRKHLLHPLWACETPCLRLQAGLDSLASLALKNNISKMLGKEVPATLAFDYPTIQALAAFVTEQLANTRGVPTAVVESPPAMQSIRHTLHTMLERVLGVAVLDDQPLMEAWSLTLSFSLSSSSKLPPL